MLIADNITVRKVVIVLNLMGLVFKSKRDTNKIVIYVYIHING